MQWDWKPRESWEPALLGLMSLGGGMMAANQPGASMSQAVGHGMQNAVPTYLLARRENRSQKEAEEEKKRRADAANLVRGMFTGQGQGMAPAVGGRGAAAGAPQLTQSEQAWMAIDPMGFLESRAKSDMKGEGKPDMFERWMQDPDLVRKFKEQTTIRQPGTSVNVKMPETYPTAPAGWAYFPKEGGGFRLDPVPGGPAEMEIAGAEAKATAAQGKKEATADFMVQDIGRVRDLVDGSKIPVTGPVGAVASSIPGTGAHDAYQLLEGIKSNIGFGALQAMRDSSPTGGALGQVTERELALLQRTAGSVEQSQSEDQFLRNLDRLKEQYNEVIHGKGGAPAAASDDDLLNKYAPR